MFTDAQLYTVIILANGGPDLEAFSFPSLATSWRQACSIFWQVTKSIAQAETLAHFEVCHAYDDLQTLQLSEKP